MGLELELTGFEPWELERYKFAEIYRIADWKSPINVDKREIK